MSIQAVRKGLKTSQYLVEKLKQTNLSFDSSIEQATLHQPVSLDRGDITSECGRSHLQISDLRQVKLQLNPLERVIIHQEIDLFPGVEVQLTDIRFRWKGIIVENTGDRALVNWGGSQRWHPVEQLRLLVDAKLSIFQIALRRNGSHITKPVVTKPLSVPPVPTPPPQPSCIQTELFEWDCFEDW